MGKANLAVNRLLERKEIFADLINGTIFEGKPVLQAAELEMISPHSGIMKKKEKGKAGAIEREGDIRMKAGIGTCIVWFANETQNKVHYAMPVRTMLYDALEYTKQIQDLEKQHKEDGSVLETAELLSGLTKEDRLEPVITTVLYLGESWDGAMSLYDLLKIDLEDPVYEELKEYLPNYRINLLCAADMPHTERFCTCLQHIFNMLKYKEEKELLKEYIEKHRTDLDKMDSVEMMAALVMLGEQKRVEQLLEGKNEEEEEITVCKAIEEMIQDGIEQGIEQGMEQGERRFAALMDRLLEEHREDLIPQVIKDAILRKEMYQQYKI